MKNLREKNHITVTKEGFIYLTDTGRQIAEMIYERHELISGWLIQLGVDPETAVSDACRMEHVISPESFAAIKNTFWKTAINNNLFPKCIFCCSKQRTSIEKGQLSFMVTVLYCVKNYIKQEIMENLFVLKFSDVCCQRLAEIFALLDHCIVRCLLTD